MSGGTAPNRRRGRDVHVLTARVDSANRGERARVFGNHGDSHRNLLSVAGTAATGTREPRG